MRAGLILLAVLAACMLVACGDFANTVEGDVKVPVNQGPGPNNLPSPNNVPKPGGTSGYVVTLSPVFLNEVHVDPVGPNAGHQYVELFNVSTLDADVGGWQVSDGFSTYTLPFGARIAAGQLAVVRLGVSGANSSWEFFAPSFGEMQTTQGGMALLRNGTDLVDFVQWGNQGSPFELAASNVQEWSQGDFVNQPQEGFALRYAGGPSASSAWSTAQPSH